jgi:hypothetical protein
MSDVYRTGPRPRQIEFCAVCLMYKEDKDRGADVRWKKSVRGPSKPWTADCSSGNLTPAKKKKENSLTTNREM